MKYPEEDIARDLHDELVRVFSSTATSISINGAGVQWNCVVARGDSQSRVHCFTSLGAQYYTCFERHSQKEATSRTSSRDGTIAAIRDWLEGYDLPALYELYPFIDHTKRVLTKLQNDVLEIRPELRIKVESELLRRSVEFHELRFQAGDRCCNIGFQGQPTPYASFRWDECELFGYFPDDIQLLAQVLNRWIGERAMPSQMRPEFPWLEIATLADYYERGIPIEGEFIESWNSIEEFYQGFKSQSWSTICDYALSLIREIRQAGYDRLIRAGQSMTTLGVSRSRRHGLREGQPNLWFDFHKNGAMTVHSSFSAEPLKQHPIRMTNDVRTLLDSLVRCQID